MTLVGPCGWCLSLVVMALLFSSSQWYQVLVSMFGSQVLQGSSTGQSWCPWYVVPCENSTALRGIWFVLCGPREFWQRGLPD